MDDYSDIELINLAVDGNERAFEELIQRHYLSVYRFSFKWCQIKEDAEEITQEVFMITMAVPFRRPMVMQF